MAYNTTVIKKDADNKPIPQYYNPVTDEYEVLQGVGGAARQVLYGPDGNPISVVDNKLAVRAAELETAISNLQTALLGSQSTAAKQDALAGLVGALDAVAVSDPAAAGAVIALLKGLLSRLQTLENKIDSFTTGEETVNTELKGSIVEYEGGLYTLSRKKEEGIVATNATIIAGGMIEKQGINAASAKDLVVGAKGIDASHSVAITIHHVDLTTQSTYKAQVITQASGTQFLTDKITLLTSRFNYKVENKDAVDHTYSKIIYWLHY